ncbi:HNH endonuclease [Bosea sp. OK403]|uniref:HNH endonuclease n=1 Tax=Bosea sp. OK403 TaxID=1855286 RepID=UPI0008F21FC7|nr:HNH endonuclease [Bosea sp. OK403]SFJ13593.1 HNH endonuclease [Bosea sp. OK403]
MTWSPATKTKVLTSCGRHCCICHKFAGLKIELHHIKLRSEGGDDDADNCIPLCLDCHADMSSYDKKHPKGTKYTESELKSHRDQWYEKFKNPSLTFYDDDCKNIDTELYKSLRQKLHSETIEFVRSHPFGTIFRSANVQPLYNYADNPTRPDEEFIDPELESLRAALKDRVFLFANTLATNTWADDRNDAFAAVPREWSYNNHQKYYDVVELLHDQATEVGNAFDNLVKSALRKLNVRILD